MSTLKQKIARLDSIQAERDMYGDVFSLFEKIFIEHDRVKQVLGPHEADLPREDLKKRLENGFYVLDEKSFSPDRVVCEGLFKALLAVFAESSRESITAIEKTMETNMLTFSDLMDVPLSAEAAKKLETFRDEKLLLVYLLQLCLRPALEQYAECTRGFLKESEWSEGFCPVCGSFPYLAELRGEEGRRYLYCAECGTDWGFERIGCPFCGNDEQKKLAYFSAENELQYRVDVCKSCKRYIKTIDFRKTAQDLIPDVENLATLHLDVLAKKEGLKTDDVLIQLLL